MAKKNMSDIKVTTVINVYNHCISNSPHDHWSVDDEPILVDDEGIVQHLQLVVPNGFYVARSSSTCLWFG